MIDWRTCLEGIELQIFDYLDLDEPLNSQVSTLSDAYHIYKLSIPSISKIATVFMMIQFDDSNGIDNAGKPVSLRRHWYAWFKSFAQLFSQQARYEDIQQATWGIRWAGVLSKCYSEFVNTGLITYEDLWVRDASRMMQSTHNPLFINANILICVEKDSLFEDFYLIGQRLGVTAVYSGKGVSSKGAIEKLINEHFCDCEIDVDRPLHVLIITDYDYSGHKVISPTFYEQLSRYVKNVKAIRVGIYPQQIPEGLRLEKAYQVKTGNKSSKDWADTYGICTYVCEDCGIGYLSMTEVTVCDKCNGNSIITNNEVLGYEIEALPIADYSPLIVDMLLEVMSFDHIIDRLRFECIADIDMVTEQLMNEALSYNDHYTSLLRQLNNIRVHISDSIRSSLEGNERNWEMDDDNPTVQDYINHVSNVYDYSPWRPFKVADRNESMIDWYKDTYGSEFETFKNYTGE